MDNISSPSSGDLTEIQKKRVDALLKEYDRVTGEIKAIQDTQRRMIGLLPPALAVGLPLLLKSSADVPQDLTTAIFLGFGFMFLFFVTNYVGLTRGILRLSKFQMEHIAAQVNKILSSGDQSLLNWEVYIRTNIRQDNKELIGYALIHGPEFLLLSSPSLACMGLGIYFGLQGGFHVAVLSSCLAYVLVGVITVYFAYLTVAQSRAVPSAPPRLMTSNKSEQ